MVIKNLNSRRYNKSVRRQTGFTLLEIMIVVFIIALLLNIASPAFVHARDNAWCRSCCSNLHNIELAKEQFAFDNNEPDIYTPQWSDISGYLNSSTTAPLCPATGAVYYLNDMTMPPACSYGGPVGLPHTIQ
jgi:prepilin-type N-terminal cleavage/methylation domain-containing protein